MSRRRGTGTRRPHKAFVHDIGPTFSYATAERAHAKAAELVSGEGEAYGRVSVYSVDEHLTLSSDMTRTLYRYGAPPVRQRLCVEPGRTGWVDA